MPLVLNQISNRWTNLKEKAVKNSTAEINPDIIDITTFEIRTTTFEIKKTKIL